MHPVVLVLYMCEFCFTYQTQQKQTPNNSHSTVHIWVYLVLQRRYLHVSTHGAIIRRYINKSYIIELCFLYGSVYCFFLSWYSTSDESRRNSVSLNKDYIPNNTLNIPNYDRTPNINIINTIREDSCIMYTTLSN
jgi:hypothetical protein